MYDFSVKEYISGSIFKFFPLAFWIVLSKDLKKHKIRLTRMPIAPNDNDLLSFIMDYRQRAPERFPLDPPPERSVILANRESGYYAKRKKDGRLILTVRQLDGMSG